MHHHHHPPQPQPPHQPPLSKPTTLPNFLLTTLSLFLFTTKHPPRPLSLTTTNRRLSSTTMSQNPYPNPNFSSFPNPQSLSDWLKPRLPPASFSAWGTKPGTKNVHNLWLELSHGETHLLDNPNSPPIRNLEVLCVRIITKDRNFMLIESHQELSDGSVRTRDRPLSEKLKSGEGIEDGVRRAIREELGSVLKDVNFDDVVRVLDGSYERKVEERVSVSYPGLPACYVLHTMDALVEGLPEGEFVTTEEGGEYGDGDDDEVKSEAVSVRKHFWRWVPAGSV